MSFSPCGPPSVLLPLGLWLKLNLVWLSDKGFTMIPKEGGNKRWNKKLIINVLMYHACVRECKKFTKPTQTMWAKCTVNILVGKNKKINKNLIVTVFFLVIFGHFFSKSHIKLEITLPFDRFNSTNRTLSSHWGQGCDLGVLADNFVLTERSYWLATERPTPIVPPTLCNLKKTLLFKVLITISVCVCLTTANSKLQACQK